MLKAKVIWNRTAWYVKLHRNPRGTAFLTPFLTDIRWYSETSESNYWIQTHRGKYMGSFWIKVCLEPWNQNGCTMHLRLLYQHSLSYAQHNRMMSSLYHRIHNSTAWNTNMFTCILPGSDQAWKIYLFPCKPGKISLQQDIFSLCIFLFSPIDHLAHLAYFFQAWQWPKEHYRHWLLISYTHLSWVSSMYLTTLCSKQSN